MSECTFEQTTLRNGGTAALYRLNLNSPDGLCALLADGACYRGRYKDEYAEAIREIEAVKSEMEAVKQKASTNALLASTIHGRYTHAPPTVVLLLYVGGLALNSVLPVSSPLPSACSLRSGCVKPKDHRMNG